MKLIIIISLLTFISCVPCEKEKEKEDKEVYIIVPRSASYAK